MIYIIALQELHLLKHCMGGGDTTAPKPRQKISDFWEINRPNYCVCGPDGSEGEKEAEKLLAFCPF
jgi:hypothetical protein